MPSDLSLPKIAATGKYSHENHDTDKIAIYTLFKLQDEPGGLEQAIAHELNVTDAYAICDEDFVDAPLRDVLQHHLRVAEQRRLEPTLFIVAHTEHFDEQGVLLINANFDLKGGVDARRVKTSIALLEAVNLQIGNTDWDEIEGEDFDELASERLVHDAQTATPVAFGLYGIKTGANMTKIRDLLEPDWLDKAAVAWRCESVGSYTSGPNPLKEVIKHHPWHCLRNTRMSRQWCICVDSLDPSKDGVLGLHIDWDGDIRRAPNELLQIGAQSDVATERLDVSDALIVLSAR